MRRREGLRTRRRPQVNHTPAAPSDGWLADGLSCSTPHSTNTPPTIRPQQNHKPVHVPAMPKHLGHGQALQSHHPKRQALKQNLIYPPPIPYKLAHAYFNSITQLGWRLRSPSHQTVFSSRSRRVLPCIGRREGDDCSSSSIMLTRSVNFGCRVSSASIASRNEELNSPFTQNERNSRSGI